MPARLRTVNEFLIECYFMALFFQLLTMTNSRGFTKACKVSFLTVECVSPPRLKLQSFVNDVR